MRGVTTSTLFALILEIHAKVLAGASDFIDVVTVTLTDKLLDRALKASRFFPYPTDMDKVGQGSVAHLLMPLRIDRQQRHVPRARQLHSSDRFNLPWSSHQPMAHVKTNWGWYMQAPQWCTPRAAPSGEDATNYPAMVDALQGLWEDDIGLQVNITGNNVKFSDGEVFWPLETTAAGNMKLRGAQFTGTPDEPRWCFPDGVTRFWVRPGRPVPVEAWIQRWVPLLNVNSGRRALLGIAIVLGSNFLGATSRLLSLNVEGSRALRLDTLIPVDGMKRCFQPENGFEFLYPGDYLADQTLLRRQQRAREDSENPFDPPSLLKLKERGKKRNLPAVGFGPAGGNGDENVFGGSGEEGVSCILSPLPEGVNFLNSITDAQSRGNWLLSNVIAPSGSGRVTQLIAASQSFRPGGVERVQYFNLEYVVESPKFKRHVAAVFAQYDRTLFTFTAQVPESKWLGTKARQLEMAQASFRILQASTGSE